MTMPQVNLRDALYAYAEGRDGYERTDIGQIVSDLEVRIEGNLADILADVGQDYQENK